MNEKAIFDYFFFFLQRTPMNILHGFDYLNDFFVHFVEKSVIYQDFFFYFCTSI